MLEKIHLLHHFHLSVVWWKLVLELEVGVPLAGGRDVCATVTCTSELAMARESWVLVTAVVDLRCERGHTPQLRLHVQVPYARDVGVAV